VSVSIVVPCYRSASTLPTLVARVNEVMPRVAAAYEVILVVDSTGDAHSLYAKFGFVAPDHTYMERAGGPPKVPSARPGTDSLTITEPS